jgi:hypothetical protein
LGKKWKFQHFHQCQSWQGTMIVIWQKVTLLNCNTAPLVSFSSFNKNYASFWPLHPKNSFNRKLEFTINLFKETFMGLPCPMTLKKQVIHPLVHGKRIKEKSDGSNKRCGMSPKLSPSFYPTKMHTFHYKKQKALG